MVESPPAVAGDAGLIPGVRGLIPGVRKILGKGMETHSSVLLWEIPWAEEPGAPVPGAAKESDRTQILNNNKPPGWDLNQGPLDFKVTLPAAHKHGNELPSGEHLSPQPELSTGFTSVTLYIWAKRRVTQIK